jgi:hypothetical protein
MFGFLSLSLSLLLLLLLDLSSLISAQLCCMYRLLVPSVLPVARPPIAQLEHFWPQDSATEFAKQTQINVSRLFHFPFFPHGFFNRLMVGGVCLRAQVDSIERESLRAVADVWSVMYVCV